MSERGSVVDGQEEYLWCVSRVVGQKVVTAKSMIEFGGRPQIGRSLIVTEINHGGRTLVFSSTNTTLYGFTACPRT